jgi:hypothetical protein
MSGRPWQLILEVVGEAVYAVETKGTIVGELAADLRVMEGAAVDSAGEGYLSSGGQGG